MTETEYLLICLAEEAGEIIQACAKALRFGLDDGYPGTDRTNAGDIDIECTHLWAVHKMIEDRGIFPVPMDRGVAENKETKVLSFMQYAKDRGTIPAT